MMKLYVFLVFILIQGCTIPKRSTGDLKAVPKNQVILVGKLSINKKLPESSHVIDVMDMTKSGLIRAGDSPQQFAKEPPSDFEKNDILVKWHDTFSVPYDRFNVIYVSGVYAFSFDKFGQNTYLFPIRGEINTKTGSRFVYVGHISLQLDDFFVLKSAKVIDEFDKDPSLQTKFKGIKKSLFVIHN